MKNENTGPWVLTEQERQLAVALSQTDSALRAIKLVINGISDECKKLAARHGIPVDEMVEEAKSGDQSKIAALSDENKARMEVMAHVGMFCLRASIDAERVLKSASDDFWNPVCKRLGFSRENNNLMLNNQDMTVSVFDIETSGTA